MARSSSKPDADALTGRSAVVKPLAGRTSRTSKVTVACTTDTPATSSRFVQARLDSQQQQLHFLDPQRLEHVDVPTVSAREQSLGDEFGFEERIRTGEAASDATGCRDVRAETLIDNQYPRDQRWMRPPR